MMKCSRLTFAGALLAASIGTLLVTLAPPAVRGGCFCKGTTSKETQVCHPRRTVPIRAVTAPRISGGTIWPSRPRRYEKLGSPPSGCHLCGREQAGPPPSVSTCSMTMTWGRKTRAEGEFNALCPRGMARANSSNGAWRFSERTASMSTSTSWKTSEMGATDPAGSRFATRMPLARSAAAGSPRTPIASITRI